MQSRLQYWADLIRHLGIRGTIGYRRLISSKPKTGSISSGSSNSLQSFHVKGIQYPVFCRADATDSDVFHQLFLRREYACVESIERDAKFIIDCGANIGLTSVYFLNRFPNARLVAIEPDSNNFAVLERNVRPYGDRVEIIKAGVWSHTTGLVVHTPEGRENEAWAIQVRAAAADETPDVEAIDLLSVLARAGGQAVDLLKVDIEFSEIAVFGQNYEGWLSKVRNIVIELHGPECEAVFYKALKPYTFEKKTDGELTLCTNLIPKVTSI